MEIGSENSQARRLFVLRLLVGETLASSNGIAC